MMREYDDLLAAVQANKGFLIKTLQDMVRIDTCVPPGLNYDRMIDVLEPVFEAFSFDTQRVLIPQERIERIPLPLQGERVNLVARKEAGLPPVSIYAHMDTVPVGDGWTHDPFAGEIEGGEIYGRGVYDMKGAIACLLTTLKVMDCLGLKPKFDIHCLMCTDEEIGVYPGAYHLALEGYFKGHLLWLELGYQDPFVVEAANGMVDTEIEVVGRSCHSGMNFMGINALEESVPILNELLELKKDVEKRESVITALPRPNAPSPKMTPMFNIDIIRSGTKSNVVPGTCKIVVNRRYLPDERYSDVIDEIEKAIRRGAKRSKALKVEINHVQAYKPVLIDTRGKHAERARRMRMKVHGYDRSDFITGGTRGSTDMGFVTEALGSNKVVTFGPWRASNMTMHAADEHVSIEDLVTMTMELLCYLAL